jgi:hypothetical protein
MRPSDATAEGRRSSTATLNQKRVNPCPLRADRVAISGAEQATADKARNAGYLQIPGQRDHDKPVPNLLRSILPQNQGAGIRQAPMPLSLRRPLAVISLNKGYHS